MSKLPACGVGSRLGSRNRLNQTPRLASALKSIVVPRGRSDRSILWGPARGLRMEVDLHDDTQLCLGLYEREIQRWIVRLATAANTVIDVGAARGRYTLYALARTDARRVISFEPASGVRDELLRNLDLNGLARDPRLRVSPERVGRGTDEAGVVLDSFLPEIFLPCLVKVDVEGSELDVLEGARRLLATRAASWVVEVHSSDLAIACASVFRRAGLTVRAVHNAWWRALLPEVRLAAVNHWLVAWP